MSGLVSSVLGTHLPGDYGVDPLVTRHSFSAVASSNFAGSSPQVSRSLRHNVVGSFSYITRLTESSNLSGVGDTPKNSTYSRNETPLIINGEMEAKNGNPVDNSRQNSVASNEAMKANLGAGRSDRPPPKEVVFNIDSKHQFRDFRPLSFRLLRQISGISEEDYLLYISQPTKERFVASLPCVLAGIIKLIMMIMYIEVIMGRK